MSPTESKLRRLACALDASALEALASKGLLRRAQKDLERGAEARITGGTETTLALQIAGFDVNMPETGPATASCTCPSIGVCQHILMAILFLQAQAPSTAPKPGPGTAPTTPEAPAKEELLAITPELLERWAGKQAFSSGSKLAAESAPEILREGRITIRFPALNAAVHCVPGGGLDGMIVSGEKNEGRRLVVAAVMAFHAAEGMAWALVVKTDSVDTSVSAPRNRGEVLDSCQNLLHESLATGLTRISASDQQRWATLAVSALGVNLPRLALTLRSIGDEAALAVTRDARSDPARTLNRMAQTHALVTAIQNAGDKARPDLIGSHRSRYDQVGNLDLVGVAAWPWRTSSGYEGLTVLFWDPVGNSYNSWTESRPRHQLADFKPALRYNQPGPWEGAESPRQLARSSLRLLHARRNPSRRLSGSAKSRVLITGPTSLHHLEAFVIQDWSRLLDGPTDQAAAGLKENNPLDSIVALRPAIWGDRGFDAVAQVFTWVLTDLNRQPLTMQITFEELAEPGIRFLEASSPDSLRSATIVGRIQRGNEGPSLHPFSIHLRTGGVVHLGLDNAKPGAATTVAKPTHGEVEPEDEEFTAAEEEPSEPPPDALNPTLTSVLDDVDDALLALAEGGLASLHPLRVERLRQLQPRAARLALHSLANALDRLTHQANPFALLRCVYIAQLHRRAVAGQGLLTA